jgi:hypothetical protein
MLRSKLILNSNKPNIKLDTHNNIKPFNLVFGESHHFINHTLITVYIMEQEF